MSTKLRQICANGATKIKQDEDKKVQDDFHELYKELLK